MELESKINILLTELRDFREENNRKWQEFERINEKNRRKLVDIIYESEEDLENKMDWVNLNIINEFNMFLLKNNRRHIKSSDLKIESNKNDSMQEVAEHIKNLKEKWAIEEQNLGI